MIKILKSSALGVSAIISDAGNKSACESEITAAAIEKLGRPVSFMYSKGVPFSVLMRNQDAVFIDAGVPVIGETEAEQIQAAFQA